MNDPTIYNLDDLKDGPDWNDKTGSIMQRFERRLPVDAWLAWMLEAEGFRVSRWMRLRWRLEEMRWRIPFGRKKRLLEAAAELGISLDASHLKR